VDELVVGFANRLAGFHGMDSPIFDEYPFKGRSDLDIACPEEESTNEDDIFHLIYLHIPSLSSRDTARAMLRNTFMGPHRRLGSSAYSVLVARRIDDSLTHPL